MSKYHINPVTGNVKACTAQQRCPFGGADEHYDTLEEAALAYEEYMAGHTLPELTSREIRREFLIAEAERELRLGVIEAPEEVTERLLAHQGLLTSPLLIPAYTELSLTKLREAKGEALVKQARTLDQWEHAAFSMAAGALREIASFTTWHDDDSVKNSATMLETLYDRLNEQGFDAIAESEDPTPYWAAAGAVEILLENYSELLSPAPAA